MDTDAISAKREGSVVHLPGLNGIRAIAAIAVIISHTTLFLADFGLDPFLFGATPEGKPRGSDLAGFGVSMFFALSGFLITYLLLLEKEKQAIDVKNFYLRRVLRIHPLYYAYLIVALLVVSLFGLQFPPTSLLFYIFLAANVPFVLGTEVPFIGHYWSLGVEEQFYLFFPWIVKKAKNLPAVLISLTAGLILVTLLLRYTPNPYGMLPYTFFQVTRFQCMLIGALGAWFFYRRSPMFLRATTNLPVQVVSWVVVALVAVNRFHIASVLDQEIFSAVTVCVIMGQVTKTNRLLNLENAASDFVGKISYGLYVIHPLILFLLTRIIGKSLTPFPVVAQYLMIYCVVIGITVLIAYLSFHYFEKGFLRLKSRYSSVESSSIRRS